MSTGAGPLVIVRRVEGVLRDRDAGPGARPRNQAGIRPALAAAMAAGPTRAAQDEISVAVAALFSNVGEEFQALTARALAPGSIHRLGAIDRRPRAALSGAIQAGAERVSRDVGGLESQLVVLGTGGAPGRRHRDGKPVPVAEQVRQQPVRLRPGDCRRFGSWPPESARRVRRRPGDRSGPAGVQPGVVSAAVRRPADRLRPDRRDIPPEHCGAGRLRVAGGGKAQAAVTDAGRGFPNLCFTGFDTVTGTGGLVTITPGGALGDLLPILFIPGQRAQNPRRSREPPSAAPCPACLTSCRQVSRPRSAGPRRRSCLRCRCEGRRAGRYPRLLGRRSCPRFPAWAGDARAPYLQIMYLWVISMLARTTVGHLFPGRAWKARTRNRQWWPRRAVKLYPTIFFMLSREN